MAFVVVYDANVLYPVELRDFLIRLALAGIYQAKWTHQILDETFDAIVTNRPELADRLQRTRQQLVAYRHSYQPWPGAGQPRPLLCGGGRCPPAG